MKPKKTTTENALVPTTNPAAALVKKESPLAAELFAAQALLSKEAPEAERVLKMAQRVTVNTDAQLEVVTGSIREIKAKWAELEALRKHLVDPFNLALDSINGWFKTAQVPLKASEKALKGAGESYVIRAEQARQTALDKAQEAFLAGESEGVATALEQANSGPSGTAAGTSFREVWKCRVVDPDKLPREWLCPDVKAIEAYVKAKRDQAKIPGVETWAEKNMAVRK